MAKSLKSLPDIPTAAALYRAGVLKRQASSMLAPPSNAKYNGIIATIRYDITKLQVDCIVNAANESLMGGGGVDGAIHRAAGRGLLQECRTLNGCETGSAKITDAYDLPCKKVIHAVGPVYFQRKKLAPRLLKACYRTSLELAVEAGMESIAFSALSTGVYGYPSDQAAEDALSEVREWLDSGKGATLKRIIFCNFLEKDENAYYEHIPRYFPDVDPSEVEEADKDSHTGAETAAATESQAQLETEQPDKASGTARSSSAKAKEPESKKQKTLHDSTTDASADDTDKDWEKVDAEDTVSDAYVEVKGPDPVEPIKSD